MIVAVAVMCSLAVLVSILAYRQDGKHIAGWRAGMQLLIRMFPLLLAAFFLVGMLEVAVPNTLIERWLGDQSGIVGILLGSVIGGLIPVGPYVVFPIIASLYQTGASLGTIIALISGWAIWSSGRIPYEIAIVGPRFTLIRLVSALVFPPLAGIVAHLLFRG